MKLLLCFSLFVLGAIAIHQLDEKDASSPTRRELQSSMLCHVTMEVLSSSTFHHHHHNQSHHHHFFECSPVDHKNGEVSDFSYGIDLPADFIRQNTQDLVAGVLFANIPGGQVVNGQVVYPTNTNDSNREQMITAVQAPDSFQARRRRRRLATTANTRSLLVVRITANDGTVSLSPQEIYDYTFDQSDPINLPSLASQYSAMSFGKLNFVPAQGGVGVVDIDINLNAQGASINTIRDATISAVLSQFGVSSMTLLADHVMFCIPPGTGTWSGVSSVNSWRLLLNDYWCGYLSATAHEMGHNLGLLHANMNGIAYMDFTSYMSAGYETPYYPTKSFNGANNWQLGWYSDRQLAVDPSQGGKVVTLATFVDYGKSNNNNKNYPVLIKVGLSTILQYNRAKDFNSQTQMNIDQVTVVQQEQAGSTSLLGGIDSNSPNFSIANFDQSGRTLVIYICSSGFGNDNDPDWMLISIGFDRSYCGLKASIITRPPTMKPTRKRPRPPS